MSPQDLQDRFLATRQLTSHVLHLGPHRFVFMRHGQPGRPTIVAEGMRSKDGELVPNGVRCSLYAFTNRELDELDEQL